MATKFYTGMVASMVSGFNYHYEELFAARSRRRMAGWEIVRGKMQGGLPVYRAKWVGDRSKYKPHQGAAECARRVRQGLAG